MYMQDIKPGKAVRDKIECHTFHRGSYMSAHVLLNLLNELGKRDKMQTSCRNIVLGRITRPF